MVNSDLILAYLRNVQAAQENGQADHAAFLLEQAMTWLGRYDRERQYATVSSPTRLEVGIGLHAGNNPARTRNEDYVFANQAVRTLPNGERETVGLFVLADGAGGHANGQKASRLAVHAFVDEVYSELSCGRDIQGTALKNLLLEGILRANEAVYQQQDLINGFMTTTLTAALSVGTQMYIASVGDSRAYVYRPTAGLRQLTRDHSVVARLVENGHITPDEVYTHPKRNIITRSLGKATLDLDEPVSLQLQDGDVFLLCSDGLWELARDPAIQAVLANPWADAPELAEALVELALAGGGHDNIGVLVAKYVAAEHLDDTIILPPSARSMLPSLA